MRLSPPGGGGYLTYRLLAQNVSLEFIFANFGDFLCFAGTNFCDYIRADWFLLLGINFCDFQKVPALKRFVFIEYVQ